MQARSTAQPVDRSSQATGRDYVNSGNQSSFRSILLPHHDLGESGVGRRGHGGEHAAHRTEAAVEAELADEHHPFGCHPWHLARRSEQAHCDGRANIKL
jgi:hypothetical protein